MQNLIKEIRNKCLETLKLTDELIKGCQCFGDNDKKEEDEVAKMDIEK